MKKYVIGNKKHNKSYPILNHCYVVKSLKPQISTRKPQKGNENSDLGAKPRFTPLAKSL